MKVTHSAMVDRIADRFDGEVTKAAIKRILDAQSDIINSELQAGNHVIVKDVATLSTKEQGPRPVRNPQTGESWTMEAHTKPVAKFSAGLKRRVR